MAKKLVPYIGMPVLFHTTVAEFHERNRGGAEAHQGPYAGIVTKIHEDENGDENVSAIVFLDNDEQHRHVVDKPFFQELEDDEHSGYFVPMVDPNAAKEEKKPAKEKAEE